jgi:hypothetical protein
MAWELEIHHVDVRASGDATLIIAREVAPIAGAVPVVRSALIDGGRATYAGALHTYIQNQLGPHQLNVMISTHYDDDHLNGLTFLLLMPHTYNSARIYDQGWPGSLDTGYVRYVRAINGLNNNGPVGVLAGRLNRTRVTNAVLGDGAAPIMTVTAQVGLPAQPAAINLPANWLLTPAAPAEILWDGYAGGVPAGAPTITCIAANQYVRAHGGGLAGPLGGMSADPRNEKSLAFLVRFNNFRYYIGGDIETAQENAIQLFLNRNDDSAGRVLAVKASHHGANTATSRGFVDRLRPEAVFISCGTRNQFGHPAPGTANILDGLPAVPPVPAPALAPNRPVANYLTGYQTPGPPPSHAGGHASIAAGDPTAAPVAPGHIVLTVDAAQSNNNVLGSLYIGVQNAVNLAGAGAAVAVAAAEAAMSFNAIEAAVAVLNNMGHAAAVATARGAAINAGALAGAVARAMTDELMRNGGVPAGPAAAAAAAAGATIADGDTVHVTAAVTAAMTRAGLAGPAGVVAAVNAALAPGAVGHFDVTLHDYFSQNVPPVYTTTHA